MTGRRAGKSHLARLLKSRPADGAIVGTGIDWVIMDEFESITSKNFNEFYGLDMAKKTPEEISEVQQEIDKLCEHMTIFFQSTSESDIATTLSGPGMLTVNVPGKGYRKLNHVGGEEFVPTAARRGANDKIIVTFKPTAAASYTAMEMGEVDVAAQLTTGRQLLNESCAGHFFELLRAIKNIGAKERQVQEVIAKSEQYQEFGSW